MHSILLTTLNARYSHCSFGLRYLFANLKELKADAKVVEFTISQNPRDIAEAVLASNPRIVGFGVYIWNTRQTLEVVSILKRVKPELKIVLGGPEVSYEYEGQEICRFADLTIKGEADFLFYEVCRAYLAEAKWPPLKVISGGLPEIRSIELPYIYYSDEDIRNRVIYVEASRGCPYKCEYCLSSLDKSVRNFELESFLAAMGTLIDRGVRQFKFVDRTFNLSIATSSKILQFFLDRMSLGLFLHFEMVPDRLPAELRDLIKKFPEGALQFEIGIQTWSPEVAKLVSRRQDYLKIAENFAFLTSETSVHIHADLIAGLPGETIESFARGFDQVAALFQGKPGEIQVGILKRLKGTPIIRHDQEWQMVYQGEQPFQILKTRTMSFETLQEVDRFSHFWNQVANSGNFKRTYGLIAERATDSLYWEFDRLAKFLAKRHPQGHGVSLINLVESMWVYLTEMKALDQALVREALLQDYTGAVKRDIPVFLREKKPGFTHTAQDQVQNLKSATPRRQRRHLEVS
jgi:radical SAM superfamily enzyme YgiQ (UPF0313 family)